MAHTATKNVSLALMEQIPPIRDYLSNEIDYYNWLIKNNPDNRHIFTQIDLDAGRPSLQHAWAEPLLLAIGFAVANVLSRYGTGCSQTPPADQRSRGCR